jgi:hypothetical protein
MRKAWSMSLLLATLVTVTVLGKDWPDDGRTTQYLKMVCLQGAGACSDKFVLCTNRSGSGLGDEWFTCPDYPSPGESADRQSQRAWGACSNDEYVNCDNYDWYTCVKYYVYSNPNCTGFMCIKWIQSSSKCNPEANPY